jgi:hypothetical protein
MKAKIIETFSEMPGQKRTSGAARLQAQGCSVNASLVREVLEEAVLADVDVEAIRTTWQTLRMVVDVFDTSEMRPCGFNKNDPFYNPLNYEFVENLLGGLQQRHPVDLDVLTDALARLLDSYRDHHAQKFLECMLKLRQSAARMPSDPGPAKSKNTEMDQERDNSDGDKLGALTTHEDDEQMRNMRPITRPFPADEFSRLIDELKTIDPANAEVNWWYAEFCDPYGVSNVPPVQVGKEYFVRAGYRWVWFNDLPDDLRDRLWKWHSDALAFPAGLAD